MQDNQNIKKNLEIINSKIEKAMIKAGRKDDKIKLLAVSKFHPAESVIEAIKAGQKLFGENRVQEADKKFSEIYQNHFDISLHLIGQLQSNKVKNAVKIADCIESVDRLPLLDLIEKQCTLQDKKINILLEVHTGEESKSGFYTEEELYSALDLLAENKYPHINAKGFMTMAPFTSDEKLIHKSFETLRNLQEKCKKNYTTLELNELSMGMSNDFEIAIQEGSTIVRIGTAIFGERNY